jgi:hypothetical protein
MTNSDRLQEQRDHCLAQAEEARQRAERASFEMRGEYLDLARSWLLLAAELDKMILGPDEPKDSSSG